MLKKGTISMKKFILCTGLVSLISFECHALKLYLVSNHKNVGDHNQALGIGTEFEKLSPEKVVVEDLNAENLTSLEIKDKIEKDLLQEKVVFVGTGEGGIESTMYLPKDSNLITCLASHMPFDQSKHKNLLKKIDFIALPSHVTADVKEELGDKLIETIGVAHNRRPDMTTYDEYQKELPPADVYLGVYLGGDAPTSEKEMKYFTEDDASRLADYVVAKAEEINERGLKTCVLVLNGPRTGKHDNNGKEISTVHREGKSDAITEHFSKKLADKGIEYKVFDFQYNTPENAEWVSAYNDFDLVAGAVRTTKGKMFVPGESTSVVSETIDVMPFESIDTMPPGKAFIYHHSAMNDAHKAHIESELKAGRVSLLEGNQNILPASDTQEVKPTARKVIAQKLLEVASAKAPWAAADSLYRRVKQKESAEKSTQDLVTKIRTETDKKATLTYGLIGN